MFKNLDKQNEGKIGVAVLKNEYITGKDDLPDDLDVEQTFNKYDEDCDGYLNLEEYIKYNKFML